MFSFFSKIIKGWQECYDHFNSWKYLLKYPHNDFTTWEFFSYMNQEISKPYTIYVSSEDYDALLEILEDMK